MKTLFRNLKPKPENRRTFLAATILPIVAFTALANLGFAPQKILAALNAGMFILASLTIALCAPSKEEEQKEVNNGISRAVRKIGAHLSYDRKKRCSVESLLSAIALDEQVVRMSSSGEILVRTASTSFSFFFVKAEARRSEDAKQIADGVVVFANCPHRLNGRTILLPDLGELLLGVDLSKTFRDGPFSKDGLSQIRLENSQFEKFFRVVTSDPIEARSILTPVNQEQLMNFPQRFGSLPTISLSFDKLILYIPGIMYGPLTLLQRPDQASYLNSIQKAIEAISYLIVATKK